MGRPPSRPSPVCASFESPLDVPLPHGPMSLLAHTQPRSATEIVDTSFRFYRAHGGELLVLSAFLLVPPALLTAIAPPSLGRVFQFAGNLMYVVLQGAIAAFVAAVLHGDETITATRAFGALRGRIGSVIAVGIMSGLCIGLGLVLLIVPGVIAFAWLAVSTPVAAIEGLKNSAALGRSRELARGHALHVLGTMLLVWAIVVVLVLGGALTTGLVFGLVGVPDRVTDLIAEIMMIPLFPLAGIATTLLYYDLRVRTEGADVGSMIEALPETP